MNTDLIELLPVSSDQEKVQIWIIGAREQVVHLMNECCVKKIALDRTYFTPIIPGPFADGKYMTILMRQVELEQ